MDPSRDEIFMKSLALMTVCSACIVTSGCTYCLQPVLTDADLTTDVDLSGTWAPVKGNPKRREAYTFSAAAYSGNSIYEATFQGKEFLLEVGKIGDSRYLQFKRADSAPEAPPLLTSLPVYGFAKFEIEGDTLTAHPINDNAALQLFKDEKIPFVEHEPIDMVRFYVLTQDTAALQTLVKKNDKTLFEEKPIKFHRVKVGQDSEKPDTAGPTAQAGNEDGSAPSPW